MGMTLFAIIMRYVYIEIYHKLESSTGFDYPELSVIPNVSGGWIAPTR